MKKDKLEAEELASKYKITTEDTNLITLRILDYYLTAATETLFCKTESEGIGIVNQERSKAFFYDDIAKALLNGWNLTIDQCQTGINFKVVKGKRTDQ